MKKEIVKISAIVGAMFAFSPIAVNAHGWVEFPEARQSICFEQGGFWSGDIPNAACEAAFDVYGGNEGAYPFVQRNEVAMLVDDYTNINAVKAAIPDGTLCYANDIQKKGLGIGHTDWTRTEVDTGTFELVFLSTALHNPSYWEIYLTKPGVDTSKPLNWGDLDLIQKHDDIAADANDKYRFNVTIPADRSGDAILYTRWQRDDAAGEGFYNCSDITIGSGDGPVDPPVGPDLERGDLFVPSHININTPKVGETVQYDVFNQYNELHASFDIKVSETNKLSWDRLLAASVNGYYETHHNGDVFIGDWHEEMNHYMYFKDDLHANYMNAKNGSATGQFSIKADDGGSDLAAVITPQTLTTITNTNIEHGTVVVLHPKNSAGEYQSAQWVQLSGPVVDVANGAYDEVLIDTKQLSNDGTTHELTFQLTVTDVSSSATAVYSFSVATDGESPEVPEIPEGPDGYPAWNATDTYDEHDKVEHKGKIWTAHWWTKGDEPSTTGEWGVWR